MKVLCALILIAIANGAVPALAQNDPAKAIVDQRNNDACALFDDRAGKSRLEANFVGLNADQFGALVKGDVGRRVEIVREAGPGPIDKPM